MFSISIRFSLKVAVVISALILPNIIGANVSAQTYSESQIVQLSEKLISQNANVWQVNPNQLMVDRVTSTTDGLTTIRYVQVLGGARVVNSLLAVTFASDGKYLSHRAKLTTVEDLQIHNSSSGQAQAAAKKYFLDSLQMSDKEVLITKTDQVLLDPELIDIKLTSPIRAWQVNLAVAGAPATASSVFVRDDGTELLAIRRVVRAFNSFPMPYICDLQKTKPSARFSQFVESKRIGNLSRKYIGRTAQYPLCEARDPGRLNSANAAAIRSISETVNFFRNKVGVDIAAERYLGNIAPYANFGKNLNAKSFCNRNPKSKYCVPTISGYTNVCAYDSYSQNVECPMENAFWVPWASTECHSGACSGMFFGKGFDKADDVVAHELTHGVTGSDSFLAGLCEDCDAAAISEALSDFFGEAVDQLYVQPGETPDPNWSMGEDISNGPFRNVAMTGLTKPCRSSFGWVPIKQIDDLWDPQCDPHTNLGPADRFAWLISNGGTQNGITVMPIGVVPQTRNQTYGLCNKSGSNCTAIVNMSRLAFQVLPKLDGNTTYSEFGSALSQACRDLTRAPKNPFPSSYCTQVTNALAATGITQIQVHDLTRINTYSGLPETITARFGTSGAIAGQSVTLRLQYRALGTSIWQTLVSTDTDADGQASFQTTFPGTGTYRVITAASDSVGTFSSVWVTMN